MSAEDEGAVHASARIDGPDMFDGTEAAPEGHPTGDCIQIDAVLASGAEVRSKLVGDGGHVVPVLCLELLPLNGTRRSIHAEQLYTEATRKDAEAFAATLKRGARVTLTTPVADMRVFFPHVSSIALNPQPDRH